MSIKTEVKKEWKKKSVTIVLMVLLKASFGEGKEQRHYKNALENCFQKLQQSLAHTKVLGYQKGNIQGEFRVKVGGRHLQKEQMISHDQENFPATI